MTNNDRINQLTEENQRLQAEVDDIAKALAKFATEQQIKALECVKDEFEKATEMPLGLECRSKGASCYNWAMFYAQELSHKIAQLRANGGGS